MSDEGGSRASYWADVPPGIAFPTHRHTPEFWEALGRAVATFGFLEEVLVRAIFALTGTRTVDPAKADEELAAWVANMERALSDQLGALIDKFGTAARAHPEFDWAFLDRLLGALRDAATLRNALCHGSWGPPDAQGASLPFYVDRKRGELITRIDRDYLERVQKQVAKLAAGVMTAVTHMGYQFPGTGGPGHPIAKVDVSTVPNP